MKKILSLFLACFLLAACLSPEDAESLGLKQGLEGKRYSSIPGKSTEIHRLAWAEGNATYCETVSYSELARNVRSLPTGVCTFSNADVRSYCDNINYAAFGRVERSIPEGCSISETNRRAYINSRDAAFCTRDQGRSDAWSQAKTRWQRGVGYCSIDVGSERNCERIGSMHTTRSRGYCRSSHEYWQGVRRAFLEKKSEPVQIARKIVRFYRSATIPFNDADLREWKAAEDYLLWAPHCDLVGYNIEC